MDNAKLSTSPEFWGVLLKISSSNSIDDLHLAVRVVEIAYMDEEPWVLAISKQQWADMTDSLDIRRNEIQDITRNIRAESRAKKKKGLSISA